MWLLDANMDVHLFGESAAKALKQFPEFAVVICDLAARAMEPLPGFISPRMGALSDCPDSRQPLLLALSGLHPLLF